MGGMIVPMNIDAMRERASSCFRDEALSTLHGIAVALCDEIDRLTDPAPFNEAWLREVAGFERRPQSEGLFRGMIWATQSYNGWWFNVQDPKVGHYLAKPQPQCMGDVWTLIERVEREPKNA